MLGTLSETLYAAFAQAQLVVAQRDDLPFNTTKRLQVAEKLLYSPMRVLSSGAADERYHLLHADLPSSISPRTVVEITAGLP